jgi:trimeric autotransporter adhesin
MKHFIPKVVLLVLSLSLTCSLMAQNVGVGILTPTLAKLQVQGSVGNTVAMYNLSPNSQGVSVVSDWPGLYFNCYYNGGVKAMAASGYPSIINTDQGNGAITFATTTVANTVIAGANAPIERMRISGAGYVGIGTLTPITKLHVSGSTDQTQFILDANATQNNANPLIKLRSSTGTDLLWIHSDNQWNTFMGVNAGRVNAPSGFAGVFNTFIGSDAGYTNSAGSSNTAIGYRALHFNYNGSQNIAIGFQSLYNNYSANLNTAIGINALSSQSMDPGFTWDSENVAIGYDALYSNQPTSTANGIRNTGVGNNALYNNTTGYYNTAIGYFANVSTGALTNATALGYFTSVNASNKVRIGNSSVGVIEGQVAYTWPSDARFKENVAEDVKGLDFIMKLHPVSYNFNRLAFAKHIKEKTEGRENELRKLSEVRSVGFLAQDIERIVKETGFTSFDAVHAPTSETDNYSLSYAHFVIPLVKAVQELNLKTETQQSEIDVLKKKQVALEKELEQAREDNKKMSELSERLDKLEKLLANPVSTTN